MDDVERGFLEDGESRIITAQTGIQT